MPSPPSGGGFDFLADPNKPAPTDRALWRADVNRFTVLIGPPPAGFGPDSVIDPARIDDLTVLDEGEDGLHAVAGRDATLAHVRIEPTAKTCGSVILPAEPASEARISAARWFLAQLRGEAAGPSPERLWCTSNRLSHLRNLLRLLDGRHAGATSRQLAAVLLDKDVADLSAAAWVDSSERKRLRRWLAQADRLVTHDYLKLLHGP